MAITTYAELQSAVADWLNRDDLTSVIPNFIELAEADLTRNLRHRKMIVRADANLNAEYTQTPSDWFQTQSLILETDPVTKLEYLTPEALNAKRAYSVAVGKPLFFTMIGTEIQVYPPPDGTYMAEIVYYAEIPALTDSNTTNWLLSGCGILNRIESPGKRPRPEMDPIYIHPLCLRDGKTLCG